MVHDSLVSMTSTILTRLESAGIFGTLLIVPDEFRGQEGTLYVANIEVLYLLSDRVVGKVKVSCIMFHA